MRSCLDDDEIMEFVAGATRATARPAIHDHLGTCSRCRVLVAQTRKAMPPTPLAGVTATGGHPLAAQETEVMLPEVVGRYTIQRLLGAGGTGMVFEAFDPHLSRRVALKLLRPDRRSQDPGRDAERLLREARAMAQLSHPSVVGIFDAGPFDGGVFIAMELVPGRTLATWLSQERPGWREVIVKFISAGEGLVAAHAAGLVHRDFKPENVLIGADGRARVTDFGLARAVTAANPAEGAGGPSLASSVHLRSVLLTLTEGAAFAGTPAYMAPEQFRGVRADEATDQFNFCASLYSALYRQPPFAASPDATLADLAGAVMRGELRPPPANTDVPARVFAFLQRGLAPVRQDRFPSMAALLVALAALDDTHARKKDRTWVAVLGLMGVSAAALTVGFLMREERRPSATTEAASAPSQRPIEVAIEPAQAAASAAPNAFASPDATADAGSPDRPAASAKAPTRRRRAAARARKRPPDRLARPEARPAPAPVTKPLHDGLKDPYPSK